MSLRCSHSKKNMRALMGHTKLRHRSCKLHTSCSKSSSHSGPSAFTSPATPSPLVIAAGLASTPRSWDACGTPVAPASCPSKEHKSIPQNVSSGSKTPANRNAVYICILMGLPCAFPESKLHPFRPSLRYRCVRRFSIQVDASAMANKRFANRRLRLRPTCTASASRCSRR